MSCFIRRKLGFGLGLIAALAGTGAMAGVMTGCHGHGPEGRAEWVTAKISSKLDLNDQQKAKLDEVKTAILDARKQHAADRVQGKEELKKLVLSDKLDAAQTKALLERRHQSMESNFDPIFAKVQAFHASLTPEQKQKAADVIDKFASHWSED
jgi:protein CpxP